MHHEPSTTDPYAEIAELYDLEHIGFVADLPFYVNMALLAGGPVLELGAGSGRIMAPLLDAGFKVTGLDSSAAMLDRARVVLNSKRRKGSFQLIQLPMAEARDSPGGPFGVVILGLNTLLHATTSAEQRAVLSAACSVLRAGGRLLLDVVNPNTLLAQPFTQEVVHEGAWRTSTGEWAQKFSARVLHPADQMIEVSLWYDLTEASGQIRRIHSAFDQRYVHASELELMLELAGFANWEIFGGYELEPFDDDSPQIVVAATS